MHIPHVGLLNRAAQIVTDRQGCRRMELMAELCSDPEFIDIWINDKKEQTFEVNDFIDALVKSGRVIEIEYVLKTMDYRIKSILLPAGSSDIKVNGEKVDFTCGIPSEYDRGAYENEGGEIVTDQLAEELEREHHRVGIREELAQFYRDWQSRTKYLGQRFGQAFYNHMLRKYEGPTAEAWPDLFYKTNTAEAYVLAQKWVEAWPQNFRT